jgi:hypothetical protein
MKESCGRVVAVSVSRRKEEKKTPLSSAVLVKGQGMQVKEKGVLGDSRAGRERRRSSRRDP